MPWQDPDTMDEFAIPNPDPSRHYRWLDTNPKKLRRWLLQGKYELECGATREATEKLAEKLFGPAGAGMVADGINRIMAGDHYLASIPIEEYERRRQLIAAAGRDAVSRSEDDYMDKAARIPHVTPFKRDVEEIEDRKRFALRDSTNRVGYTGASPASS